MPYLNSFDGTPLYAYDPNPGGGHPILFLHGWPLDHRMFEYQFSAMADRRCIALDLRGFGRSSAPLSRYDYDMYADDVAAAVAQLSLDAFDLAGYSMGGAIALRYMGRHGGMGVRRLALLSAAAPRFTRAEDFPYGIEPSAVDALIRRGFENRPAMLADFSDLFFQPGTDASFRDWARLLTYEASAYATMLSLFTLRDGDLRGDIAAVRVPTGIFHGKLDRVCLYGLAEAMHAMLPGSTLFPFENSGHCIFHDELAAFQAALSGFLAA